MVMDLMEENVGFGAMNCWKEPPNTKALVVTLPLLLM
jgi:hypothetical protein